MHVCDACHGQTPKWQGQCPHCGEWNSLQARAVPSGPRAAVPRKAGLVAADAPAALSTAMQAAAEQIAKGQMDVQLSINTHDELEELGKTFSRRAESLSQVSNPNSPRRGIVWNIHRRLPVRTSNPRM